MRRLLGMSTLIALLFAAGPAWSKDKDKDKDKDDDDEEVDASDKSGPSGDVFKEDDNSDEPKVERAKEDDTEPDDPKDEIDFSDEDSDDGVKFEDEDEGQQTVGARAPGEDNAQLYRDQQKKVADMTPDEEQLAWEKYLQKYPKTLFRDRIEERMETLSTDMFSERVPGSDRGEKEIDAAQRELNFATPIKFQTVDTRTHVALGFELGFPNWFALRGDFEYAFLRQLSAHVGLDGKVTSPTVHFGAKYAAIKSARTRTILTPQLDFDLLTKTDGFPILPHPSVAFGQRIDVMSGLDIQASVGARLDFRSGFEPIYTGGLNIELRPNDIVSAFVETSVDLKYIGSADVQEPFKYCVGTFGIRFRARAPTNSEGDGRVTAGIAATAPYAYSYWGYYRGAAAIFGDAYL